MAVYLEKGLSGTTYLALGAEYDEFCGGPYHPGLSSPSM